MRIVTDEDRNKKQCRWCSSLTFDKYVIKNVNWSFTVLLSHEKFENLLKSTFILNILSNSTCNKNLTKKKQSSGCSVNDDDCE